LRCMCCQRSGLLSRLMQTLYGNVSSIIPVGGFAMALVILSAFTRVVLERLRRCVGFQRGGIHRNRLAFEQPERHYHLEHERVNTFSKMSFRPNRQSS